MKTYYQRYDDLNEEQQAQAKALHPNDYRAYLYLVEGGRVVNSYRPISEVVR